MRREILNSRFLTILAHLGCACSLLAGITCSIQEGKLPTLVYPKPRFQTMTLAVKACRRLPISQCIENSQLGLKLVTLIIHRQ